MQSLISQFQEHAIYDTHARGAVKVCTIPIVKSLLYVDLEALIADGRS